MKLINVEYVLPKAEAVRQTFNGSLDKHITRMIEHELILQMFDAGAFKIEKVVKEESNSVYIRVSTLVENPSRRAEVNNEAERYIKPFDDKPKVHWGY